MAQLTIASASAGSIPPRPGRKALVMNLESGDARWGFESDVTVSGATQGLPLTIGQPVAFAGADPNVFAGPLFLASTAGCVITWTQRL